MLRRGYSAVRPGLAILMCCLALRSLAADGPAPADIAAASGSRFQRTVSALHSASDGQRADFAGTALVALTEVYAAEADLARNEARRDEIDPKLMGWSLAVDQYANQLLLVMEDIEQGYPVTISSAREETVSISVAGRVVILSHPRAAQQAAFEQRVLLDFCVRTDCEAFTAADREPEPIPVSAGQVRPDWAFTQSGPVCTHKGIVLGFSAGGDLPHARDICERLLQEALTLGNEIAWQRRHGVSVDWDSLSFRPTPRRPQHQVLLNEAGDSILATLPLINGSGDLLQDLVPWLRNRFSGEPSVTLRLQAAHYGWD